MKKYSNAVPYNFLIYNDSNYINILDIIIRKTKGFVFL